MNNHVIEDNAVRSLSQNLGACAALAGACFGLYVSNHPTVKDLTEKLFSDWLTKLDTKVQYMHICLYAFLVLNLPLVTNDRYWL